VQAQEPLREVFPSMFLKLLPQLLVVPLLS